MESINVEGYVEKIVFHNEDNGYTVFSVSDSDSGEEITCTGSGIYLNEGQYVKVSGEMTVHKNYGPQLAVREYYEKEPENVAAIEKYLASGAIKGIGEALAARIVKKFGKETFDIMDNTPEKLAEVKGISKKKARDIAEQFTTKRKLRKAMIYLQQYNIPMNLSVKIYKEYGEKMYDILSKNPYKLADDISGVGFKTADQIAASIGISADSEYRIRSGMLYVLNGFLGEGDCYLPYEKFAYHVANLLQVDEELVQVNLSHLMFDKSIVVVGDENERRVYLSNVYYMEKNSAAMVSDLNLAFSAEDDDIDKQVKKTEKKLDIELDEIQKTAVKEVIKNGVVIITGGPGTGKTTTINSIIDVLEREGMEVLLAAPTGRAAKRMTESSGHEAQTIHRLLEIGGMPDDDDKNEMRFARNESSPLEADVVIIDEMSMVDIFLFYALLKAIVPGMRLVLVGDVNQLPSVGPGNVLRDLINANFCSVVKLEHIFRQAALSDIVQNAHKINSGIRPVFDNKSKDFFLMRRSDANNVIGTVISLVRDKIPKYVNASVYDLQVLAPMKKGELGVDNLNVVLQKYLNPPEPGKNEHEFRGLIFRENDKVMQIKNNYSAQWQIYNKYRISIDEGSGVFNGDLGVIKEIDEVAERVTCVFDGNKEIEYSFQEMDQIAHAFATTVHKSQGSEYPAVIMPILGGPRALLNRNILYTAVTRAKKCVILVGSEETVVRMIDTKKADERFSSLEERIVELSDWRGDA
ncbi:MAG: ATP-dependent RecD-like DNA helicase [Lachnospiraceae bacterium]|nr:ATP-dependent RecD-like DNA helicase [Lachnospiraceae bacterium]